jgi:hypothetical protein
MHTCAGCYLAVLVAWVGLDMPERCVWEAGACAQWEDLTFLGTHSGGKDPQWWWG